MPLTVLLGKAALALGGALDALLLPGAGTLLSPAVADGGGGAPIGEPDEDEGYVEDDEEDDDDDDDDEDPLNV